MKELYLSSRVDILRKVNMDTGRRVAFVGVPREFRDWMEKTLPMDTCIVDEPGEIPGGSSFDIIICWEESGVRMDRIENLARFLSKRGDLWVIASYGPERDRLLKKYGVKEGLVLKLTPTKDLIPVIIANTDQ
ncbi:MAG: hypothetical protein JW939_00015 [Candidatus Thermoplasmatota archaeon]|nr:hypothetical protein [Candidatus Thermoplasmatota archaeon]